MQADAPTELREAEQRSFENYCRLVGLSQSEAEEHLLPPLREKVQRLLRFVQNQVSVAAAERLSDSKIFSSVIDSYVDVNRVFTEEDKSYYIERVISSADRLPINFGYLASLADQLQVPEPKVDNSDSLRPVLQSILAFNLFEPEFNAFITGKSKFRNIPAVVVYPFLSGTLWEILNVVIPITGLFGDPLSDAEVNELASRPRFMEVCLSCFDAILCGGFFAKSYNDIDRLSSMGDAEEMHLDIINGGAWDFVWLHEYGHLLLGHLDRPAGHDVEHDADSFAIRALALNPLYEKRPEVFPLVCVGVITLLLVVHILQVSQDKAESETHPSTMSRLYNYLGDQELKWFIARRIVAGLRPTCQSRWGIQLTLNNL